MDKVKIKRALISVSNKKGIVDFAKKLSKFGVGILSTGGTAKALKEAGLSITEVSEVTKFPEMLDGRVKTLHPAIHGALLALRGKKEHMETLKKHDIEPIDMVVVNLYPFAETIAKSGVKLEEAIEQIDIGGPSMIRSAAKNFESVAVIISPERYEEVLTEMKENEGCLTRETRFDLARDAFCHTADYDETIYQYLKGGDEFPKLLKLVFTKLQDLRYGENPHQQAAWYGEEGAPSHSLVYAQQLHGKDLSFNNILDLDAAWGLVNEFTVPAAVIVKHNNPCGVALAENILAAYERAYECDSVSAFGGIVAVNRVVDEALAKQISTTFIEALIAPAYVEEALEILTKKKDIRLMYMGEEREPNTLAKDFKRIDGGILLQDKDESSENRKDMKIVAGKLTEALWEDLLFAWRVAKQVKSNAIILAKDLSTVGIGAGQMSRIDACDIAIKKAGKERCKGSVLASDAFFPFRDVVDLAAKVGVKAVIQPGGSIRDEEVIAAANEHKLALVFTGKRHFRH